MSRGKHDITVTRHLRSAGFFVDARSFVSLDGHLFLYGEDKSRVRPFVFKRAKNRCEICGHKLRQDEEIRNQIGNWHHVFKCDCVECSELRCDVRTGRPCHAHRTPGFKRKAEAAKDFEKLYPTEEN